MEVVEVVVTDCTELSESQQARLALDMSLEGELQETMSRALAAAAGSGRWISFKRVFKRMASGWRTSDKFTGIETALHSALKLTSEPSEQRKLYKSVCQAMLACPRPSLCMARSPTGSNGGLAMAMSYPEEMAAYLRLRSELMDLVVAGRDQPLSYAIEVLCNDVLAPHDGSSTCDLVGRSDLFEVVCQQMRKGPCIGSRKHADLCGLYDQLCRFNPSFTPLESKYRDFRSNLKAKFPELEL